MALKLGLLISDDPDDYQILYEAFDEIASEVIIVNVGNNTKAIRYLQANERKPDFLIIDISAPTDESEQVYKLIKQESTLASIPKLALVETGPLSSPDTTVIFLNKTADFDELKKALRQFLAR